MFPFTRYELNVPLYGRFFGLISMESMEDGVGFWFKYPIFA